MFNNIYFNKDQFTYAYGTILYKIYILSGLTFSEVVGFCKSPHYCMLKTTDFLNKILLTRELNNIFTQRGNTAIGSN